MQTAEMVIVTKHAKKRFKQRVGLPKRICLANAEKAFTVGFRHCDARGKAGRYLDKLFLEHRTANNLRVYGQFVYVFKGNLLITIVGLPKSVRKGFKKKNATTITQ